MSVIFKKEKINLKNAWALRGTRRNLISQRCVLCNLLFETYKNYRHQVCILCRFEKWNGYKKRFFEKNPDKNVEEIYKKSIEKHNELDNIRNRIAEAQKCKIINTPTCLRIKKNEI